MKNATATILDAAIGSRVTIRQHRPNGTRRDESGVLLAHQLDAQVPYVVLGTASKQHAEVVFLGVDYELTLPYEPPAEHPGLGPGEPTHPGLG